MLEREENDVDKEDITGTSISPKIVFVEMVLLLHVVLPLVLAIIEISPGTVFKLMVLPLQNMQYNLISAPTASVSTTSAADNCTIESGSAPATISSLVNTESAQVVAFNFRLFFAT